MLEREKTSYGCIYRATNLEDGKVYIGQTTTGRWNKGQNPIEERWKEEVGEAYRKMARGENLRYVENAITKYGPESFELVQQDTAYSQEELDAKETHWINQYDSMNPDNGYNLKEGGMGGRLSEQAKENISRVGTEKWQSDLEYREKQLKERQERAENNPEWAQKMTEINQEIARNPKVQEKMSKILTEKWQNQKYQESVSNGLTEKWKDEHYRERQAQAKAEGRQEIPDKAEFLKNITEMKKKDINSKYDIDGKSINLRIEEMLKHQGVRTYSEAKKYLEDKNIQDVLKDIEKRQAMEQKPDFKEKMTEINRERAKDPEWRAKLSEAGTNKWRESEYREKQGKERLERAKDPQFREKMREIGKQYRKEIPDKGEFLKEIKENMPKKDMLQKYDMGKNSFEKRIQEMFGPDGSKNYTELKEYMKDKNVNDVLKDIEDREKENQSKPDSENETQKEKEESKPEEKLKENPEVEGEKEEEEKKAEITKEGDKEITPEKGEDVATKDISQEISDDKTKGDNEGEQTTGEDIKTKEPDYAGIEEDLSKEGASEKKSDLQGILKTTPGYPGIYDTHNVEIIEPEKRIFRRDDGKIPNLSRDVNPNSIALERRLATPPKTSEKAGKHKDLEGLNLNLDVEIIGFNFELPDFPGFGGEGGGESGESTDYAGIGEAVEDDEKKSEGEGEGGSSTKERSWEG